MVRAGADEEHACTKYVSEQAYPLQVVTAVAVELWNRIVNVHNAGFDTSNGLFVSFVCNED